MLKRLYVDNYKSLVNFEITFDRINLLLGPNGAGKSNVFEALLRVQLFVKGNEIIKDIFPRDARTRWSLEPVQVFELEIDRADGVFKYELALEHHREEALARVQYERLWHNQKPLLGFNRGTVQLYRDDYSKGPSYPFDWSRSALATIFSREDNEKLTWFKKQLGQIIIVKPIPSEMSAESAEEEASLTQSLSNFASWYRHISQDQSKAIDITGLLRGSVDGFSHFNFTESGDKRILRVSFGSDKVNARVEYRFDELSDGQRVLIGLYTLLGYGRGSDITLCLDEPENYLALPEIQPWLTELYDSSTEKRLQTALISHHPELINYLLATPMGQWVDRTPNGPTRIRSIDASKEAGLPVSELVARGWIHAQ